MPGPGISAGTGSRARTRSFRARRLGWLLRCPQYPRTAATLGGAAWEALGTSAVLRVSDPQALPPARAAVERELAAIDRGLQPLPPRLRALAR